MDVKMMKETASKIFLGTAVLMAAAVLQAEPAAPQGAGPKPHPAHHAGPGPGQKFHRRPPKAFFAKLTPEERARVDQLARSGKKEELRKLMHELMYKYRPEEMKRLEALNGQYLKTQDETKRAELRKEMESLVRILFRRRQEFTKNNIAEAERQLERARKDLEQFKTHFRNKEENADQIIAAQVDFWCLTPEERSKQQFKPSGKFGRGTPPPDRRKEPAAP